MFQEERAGVRRGSRALGRRSAALVLCGALLSGCALTPPPPASAPVSGSTIPTERPTPAASPSARGLGASYTAVEPSIVTGLNSVVRETLKRGQYAYISLPSIHGGTGLRAALEADLTPQVERFRQLSPRKDAPPYPELSVNWQLVGASPRAIGVRLVTTEVGLDHTFDGKVETAWWDPAASRLRPARDLIRDAASGEFFTRLAAAARATPGIDIARFNQQLEGDWESFNSLAFTPDGDLWVEFDRAQIASDDQPVGIVMPSTGLLSSFGETALAASTRPADPALPATTASPTPTPSTVPTKASRTPTSTTVTTAAPGNAVDCAKLKCVALTFDDGPVSGTTALLDLFGKKGVRATFFMVGSNAALHPAIIRRMVAEGHVVGNHTWDHPQLTRLDANAIRREITRTSDVIVKAGAPRPTLLRPPYGATGPGVASVAAELGMAQILWNVDPLDWKDRDSDTVVERVLAATRAGSIVLSHDIHPTTRAAYARIVDGLRSRGFTLVTVPELLGSRLKPGARYFRR